MTFKPFLLITGLSIFMLHHEAHATNINCTLSMSMGQDTKDLFSMYDKADSKESCLQKCEAYAKNNVELYLESLPAGDGLSWKCYFDKVEFEHRVLK